MALSSAPPCRSRACSASSRAGIRSSNCGEEGSYLELLAGISSALEGWHLFQQLMGVAQPRTCWGTPRLPPLSKSK